MSAPLILGARMVPPRARTEYHITPAVIASVRILHGDVAADRLVAGSKAATR